MADPKPYPLLDFGGLSLEKEPWLSPNQAFRELDECYVYRGRLRKRPGARWMQQLGEPAQETLSSTPSSTWGGTLANLPYNIPHHDVSRPISSSDYNVRFNFENSVSGTLAVVVGELSQEFSNRLIYWLVDEGTTTHRGTIVWDKDGFTSGFDGFYSITLPWTHDVGSPTIDYETVPERAIVGFGRFVAADTTEYDLCFDTRRCWVLDAAEGWWYNEEPGSGDIWSGDQTNHFHVGQFDDILVINNGVDAPYKFDPSASPTLQAMSTNFDGSPGDDIDTAKMFFNVRGYGVWLAPTEGGTAHPGRARWTINGNAESYNSPNDYIDAPENDIIVTAGLVAGELYVGFRDTGWWRFEFTGDPISPFAWVPIESFLGSVARDGTVEMGNHLLARTRRGFVAVNRMGEQEIAKEIGDEPLTWNPQYAYLTQAYRYDEYRQVWWTFAEGTETTTDHVLAMTMDQEGKSSFAHWHLFYNAIGAYRLNAALTWDDIDDVMDTLEWRIDSGPTLGGFPVPIGGDLTGNIYEFKGAASDSTGLTNDEVDSSFTTRYTPIALLAKTNRISPYPGRQSILTYVDLMADVSDSADLKIRFYKDFQPALYLEKSVDLTSSTETKVVRRIPVNQQALFHTIELYDNSRSGVVVDSLIPYFSPGAPMREVA